MGCGSLARSQQPATLAGLLDLRPRRSRRWPGFASPTPPVRPSSPPVARWHRPCLSGSRNSPRLPPALRFRPSGSSSSPFPALCPMAVRVRPSGHMNRLQRRRLSVASSQRSGRLTVASLHIIIGWGSKKFGSSANTATTPSSCHARPQSRLDVRSVMMCVLIRHDIRHALCLKSDKKV